MGKGAAMPPEERKTERSQRTQSKPIFTPALNISGSVAQTKHEIRDKKQEVAAVEAEATKQQDHGQYQQVPGTATAAPGLTSPVLYLHCSGTKYYCHNVLLLCSC